MDATFKQILVGIAVALPGFLLGILGWLQVRRKDTQTKYSKEIDQLLRGTFDFAKELQVDNEDLRKDNKELHVEVNKLKDQYKLCEDGRRQILKEHTQLKREHRKLKERVDALARSTTNK